MAIASILNCDLTVRLGKDLNWWIEKATGKIPWDLDEGIGIIDPRQMSHLLDMLDELREYGFRSDIIESTFFKYSIVKELPRQRTKGRLLLRRYSGREKDTNEHLFWLPDILDEERGAYVDFIEHIVDIQVQVLNEVCDFVQPLTTNEFNEKIRRRNSTLASEGYSKHFFNELMAIIEDIPKSYESHIEEREEEFVEPEDEITDEERFIGEMEGAKNGAAFEDYELADWESKPR